MRRSSSNSHIPLPKSELRPRSKSTTRTSIKEPFRRHGSVERVLLYRQNSATNLKKNSLATPTLQNPRPSGFRSSSNQVTPVSSKSKSPFKYSSARSGRTANDKKWVNEQYLKVRSFLQRLPNEQKNLAETIRPPTMNTFIKVINILFKEIDPKVDITLANYKEEVSTRLKVMQYPGNIPGSLWKTVNTMHAWPQVMSILGWLVDVNLIINPIEQELVEDLKSAKFECGLNWIAQRYLYYNKKEDETMADKEFIKELETIVGVKMADAKRNTQNLEEKIKEFSTEQEKQLEKIRNLEKKNIAMKKEIDDLELEVETFYVEDEQKTTEVDHVIDHLKQRKNRIAEAIKKKKENITLLEEKLEKQPCSYQEKVRLLQRIEEMKHTIELKKESIAVKKECIDQREVKLAEVKKKIEKEIFHINGEIMKMSLIKPELKSLEFKETAFLSKEFANEIKDRAKKKEMFEEQINKDIETARNLISEMKTKHGCLKQQIETVINEIKFLNQQEKFIDENIKKYNNLTACLLEETEKKKTIINENIKKLQKSEPDIEKLREELNIVHKLKQEKEEHLELMMKTTLQFFEKLNDLFMDNLEKKNAIRNEIFDFLEECLKEISDQQEQILEDLHTLDSCKE